MLWPSPPSLSFTASETDIPCFQGSCQGTHASDSRYICPLKPLGGAEDDWNLDTASFHGDGGWTLATETAHLPSETALHPGFFQPMWGHSPEDHFCLLIGTQCPLLPLDILYDYIKKGSKWLGGIHSLLVEKLSLLRMGESEDQDRPGRKKLIGPW